MLTLEMVQKRFPNPVSSGNKYKKKGAYCIGGALMMSAGVVVVEAGDWCVHFPDQTTLRSCLLEVNPELSRKKAGALANAIIHYNDRYDPAGGWAALEKALSYRRPKKQSGPTPLNATAAADVEAALAAGSAPAAEPVLSR